jgi:hypothetical protein
LFFFEKEKKHLSCFPLTNKNINIIYFAVIESFFKKTTILSLCYYSLLFFFLGNKTNITQATPFYVRRQSSVDTHTQPLMTQMHAPRIPPVIEDKNEFEGV